MTQTKEVYVDVSLTVNMGNYESAKLSMGETVLLDKDEDPEQAREHLYLKLAKECKDKVEILKVMLQASITLNAKAVVNNASNYQPPKDPQEFNPKQMPDKPASKDIGNQLVELSKGKKWMWARIIYPFFEIKRLDPKTTKLWELPQDLAEELLTKLEKAEEADY